MVRNFMGLSVRPEVIPLPDDVIDAAPVRSLAMQWSYPNKAPTLPRCMPYHKDKPMTGFDSLASTGLVKITTMDAYESDHSSYSGVVQNSATPENQGVLHYTVTTYPTKHVNAHGVNSHPPVISQAANPVPSVPSGSPVVGTTDLRNVTKIPGAPAQLTLFYNGSVCVYDHVSPEKAQAIMLLAGNSPPTATTPVAPVKVSVPKTSFLDSLVSNQPYNTKVLSSSPKPTTSIRLPHTVAYSETNVSKAGEVHLYPNKVEVTLPAPTGTVPQFRRKSLARFLEKRKERVVYIASPFGSKQSSETKSLETIDQWKF